MSDWKDAWDIDKTGGSWRHGGLDICIDNKGRFVTEINGAMVRKNSLNAMKKHIDKSAKKVFEPFKAVLPPRFGWKRGKARVVTITGIGRTGRRSRGVHAFLTKEPLPWPFSECTEVLEYTPENVALMKKMEKHTNETNRIGAQRRKEFDEMEKALKYIKIEQFV